MNKGDFPPKGVHRKPMRRMSMFTSSNTLQASVGWSRRTRSDRRDSHWGSMYRKDSIRTESSSQQLPAKAVVSLENTYKTGPDEGTIFKEHKIRTTLQDILKETLDGKTYEPNETARLGLQIASMIKTFCKEMGCPRYKFVSHVVIGQKMDQSLQTASRGLWDAQLDCFANVNYQNESIFAIATVFALYYE